MNKKKIVICLIILMVVEIMLWPTKSYSLQKETHKAINEDVANSEIDGYLFDNYLKVYLGFKNGIREQFLRGSDKKRIFQWLGYGGEQEDDPDSMFSLFNMIKGNGRSNNHFHNPLKPLDEAGLNDSVLGINYSGQSSILWAQSLNQQPYGIWSWQVARNYFYDALTGTLKTDREIKFANTFRAIGQQMHLIEDASVPEHVRSDVHILRAYEYHVEQFRSDIIKYGTFWIDLMSNPITFDKAILNIPSTHSSAQVPIVQITDTDLYNGDNPAITATVYNSPQSIGISEYTNANFLSKDTMFKHLDFNYPNVTDTIIWIDNNDKEYVRKVGNGDTINHLAVTSLLHQYRRIYFPQYTEHYPLTLDEECYKEYAEHLIPRAVGYSAGLLNYFFRGTLEISPPDQVAYSVTDGSLTPYYDEDNETYHQAFTSIKAKVRNSTPNSMPGEEVQNCDLLQQNCELRAIAKYKIIPNYAADLSNYPPDGTVMQGIDFSYSVSEPIYIDSLSSTEPQEFTFDFTGNPDPNIPGIPVGITDLTLQIVFKGTLGNEQDIAVAVGLKDLMEPTHQVFWNATDMFTLNNHLYTSDEIMNDPPLAALVDFDSDGILNEVEIGEPYIDPYPMTFGVGYLSSPPEPEISFYYSSKTEVQPVAPGRHIRQVVLLDKIQDNYLVLEESDNVYGTSYFYFSSPGVVNQEEDGVWQTPTPIEVFRYGMDIDEVTPIPIRQHFHTGVLACYPMGTDSNGNPSCFYPEEESLPADLLPFPIDTIYFP